MVRFGKNGSDATSGAIRLARTHTGRDRVAVCGYHGWQDWFIGSTARNQGVPSAVRNLTHTFNYNDVDSLERLFREHPYEFAAVILEPMNATAPKSGFLEAVKDITHHHGAVLIFDETITGFRFANGGAQEYFGVTPDLATFGKGLANGYPVSAVAGRTDLMRLMEEIFFSFTFGGETLSLAAALATLNKIQREPVIDTLFKAGKNIIDGVQALIETHNLRDSISISGHPSWSFLVMRDTGKFSQWQIKTFFLQEMFARGILTLGTHNMSYAHTDQDIEKLLGAYGEVFDMLRKALDSGDLQTRLRCTPLESLFKIR
jgi:glutamate-1-semialdehyde 2,1-aminomutase